MFSATAQRVRLIEKYVDSDFIVTYGDCLSDIDAYKLVEKHKNEGRIATVAMVKPSGREELLPLDEDGKFRYGSSWDAKNDNAWTNGDCYVFSTRIFSYLTGNYELEQAPFMRLCEKDQLAAYKHFGYWLAVETKRDLNDAENLWNAGMAPWINGQVRDV